MTRFAWPLAVAPASLLLAAAAPLFAHHSFAAEFDADKKVKFSGTATKLEWMDPHASVYIDTKDQNGMVQHW